MKILNPQTWIVWLNWSRRAAAPPLATALENNEEKNEGAPFFPQVPARVLFSRSLSVRADSTIWERGTGYQDYNAPNQEIDEIVPVLGGPFVYHTRKMCTLVFSDEYALGKMFWMPVWGLFLALFWMQNVILKKPSLFLSYSVLDKTLHLWKRFHNNKVSATDSSREVTRKASGIWTRPDGNRGTGPDKLGTEGIAQNVREFCFSWE